MNTIKLRSQILHNLRTKESVSGVKLGENLGISKVAVWKHVEALKAYGYQIESSRQGYRLVSDMDTLYPWEFYGREDRIVYLEKTTSTMDTAIKYSISNPESKAIVVAEQQSNGRGRNGKKWSSGQGGLFFTLVVKPEYSYSEMKISEIKKLQLIAALTLCDVMRKLCNEEFSVKLPNDILIKGKKVAGVMCEFIGETDSIRFLDLGIGVNVANQVPDTVKFISLRTINKAITRKQLLQQFLDEFENIDMKTYDIEKNDCYRRKNDAK